MTYRPNYHLSPPSGRLNDPNGITLIDDTLHVFYQHDPGFPHAPKRTGWGHAVTTLGEGIWRHLPDALYPDFPYDANGCYSGSSVFHEGQVRLFYTGNLKVNGERVTSQNIVDVDDLTGPAGGFYRRSAKNPIIDGPAEGYTAHYRDPQVSREGERWRMVIGAQRTDETGAIVLYFSDDLESWDFAGELRFHDMPEAVSHSYMWECPNLLTLRDRADGQEYQVLVFCPQYPESDQCVYVVGRLDGLDFHVTTYRTLDHGHEFYAPQLIPYEEDALMLGWMGLPGRDDTPTLESEGWVHQLTLPRRVWLDGGLLFQELVLPRSHEGMLVKSVELDQTPVLIELIDDSSVPGFSVSWDGEGVLEFGRESEVNRVACIPGQLVFTADGCAVEVTAGNGYVAASSAVFSSGGNPWGEIQVTQGT
ncbi:glycoside hydrolase family 32 protein [Corynebacterium breve]|uniref:beta-fructofuranosidase n=1 Tax=Corynebacterium breve TaxID=3049799 RepID=A0ABY8VG64_9CORY|nr:glycoside hydrolase family 32 protein [Corynebacterium breve]WIM68092.1 glycoside hydrolase family 32 protein [Corynebacterium breve]